LHQQVFFDEEFAKTLHCRQPPVDGSPGQASLVHRKQIFPGQVFRQTVNVQAGRVGPLFFKPGQQIAPILAI
jgi:hypothetical protein